MSGPTAPLPAGMQAFALQEMQTALMALKGFAHFCEVLDLNPVDNLSKELWARYSRYAEIAGHMWQPNMGGQE